MPNTISTQELEDLYLPKLDRRLHFKRAGSIRLCASPAACKAQIEDKTVCVLYAEIVEGHVKKFGTATSLRQRQKSNEKTINAILAFQDGRFIDPKPWLLGLANGIGDKYKKQAPAVIRAGLQIEVWATSLSSYDACLQPKRNAQCNACGNVEEELNRTYETIQHGWTTNLK